LNHEPNIARLASLTPETPAELEEQVRKRLGGRIRDLRLTIRDAGLVLGGHTRSHHAKQVAQHALMDVTLTPVMANETKVSDSRRDAPSPTGAAVEVSLIDGMS
jgi:hypothetical protein